MRLENVKNIDINHCYGRPRNAPQECDNAIHPVDPIQQLTLEYQESPMIYVIRYKLDRKRVWDTLTNCRHAVRQHSEKSAISLSWKKLPYQPKARS